MSSESRSRIMARVRGASLGQGADAIEQELAGLGVAPAAPLPHEDTCIAFMVNVLRNQGTLDIAGDRNEAVKVIGRYIYQHFRSHRLVAGNDPHLAAMPWRDSGVLPRFGEVEPGEPVALSYAQWGVAETGATIFLTGKSNPSRNNLLPEHHLVLLDVNNLLPDLESLWQQLEPVFDRGGRPRGINCIAGPSSTADIEAKLVYGAHGPRAWHVILTGEVSSQQLQTALDIHADKKNPGDS
ncbi:MAG: LUD domain-containing protein [Halioglobus sp.]